MIDGRTANTVSRVLAYVELMGGELVLTKDRGRWQGQVVVGATSIPAPDRDVAYGHGSLYEALQALATELQLPAFHTHIGGQLDVAQLGARQAPEHRGFPGSARRPFLAPREAAST